MDHMQRNPTTIFLINIIAILLAYYVSLIMHEWGHGTVAWLYGVKNSPFDVQYGGWLLMNADENVNYANLINAGHGTAAALIGIAGVTISFIFVIASFILLNFKIFHHSSTKFILTYWFVIINMIPIVQYFTVSTFSIEGDVGRFIEGLNISAWWIFIPGTIFNIFSIVRILKIELVRAYVVIPIKSLLGKNTLLLTMLSILFLFIYAHGYNPLTDKGMDTFSRILAILSIALVPILFILSNPSRNWVKKALRIYSNK